MGHSVTCNFNLLLCVISTWIIRSTYCQVWPSRSWCRQVPAHHDPQPEKYEVDIDSNLFIVSISFIHMQKKISPLQADRPGSRSSYFGFRAAPAEKRKSILKSNCQKFHVAFKRLFLMQTFSLCSQPTAFLSTLSVWTPNSPPNPVL